MRVDDFSLQHTLDSGQFFRYDYANGWYECQERDHSFRIRQKGNELEFKGTSEEHVRRLFGLDQDYKKIIARLSKDKTLLPAIKKYHGLRIMKRDTWETLVSFQCSIMSNIKKIKLNMNCLAREFGKKGAFPEPGELNDLGKIKKCATGFRAKYIHEANKIVDEKWLTALEKKNYADAQTTLIELPGVGEKVADCICLFALNKFEAFPIDVWIARVMTELYFNGKKTRMKEIKKFAEERWGDLAGYAQQFLYHWGRHDGKF